MKVLDIHFHFYNVPLDFSLQFLITRSLLIVYCGDCWLNLCFYATNSQMESINTIRLFTSLILIFNNENKKKCKSNWGYYQMTRGIQSWWCKCFFGCFFHSIAIGNSRYMVLCSLSYWLNWSFSIVYDGTMMNSRMTQVVR
jgi:hypothetical protein